MFCLIVACWIHDYGLTNSALKESGISDDVPDIYSQKKEHGRILLRALINAFDKSNRRVFQDLGGFEPDNVFHQQLLEAAVIIAGYHQKRAKIEGRSSSHDSGIPSDPYEHPIPSKRKIKFRSHEEELDLPYLAALLRILDACDIQCNRVIKEGRDARLTKMEHRIKELYNNCKKICTIESKCCKCVIDASKTILQFCASLEENDYEKCSRLYDLANSFLSSADAVKGCDEVIRELRKMAEQPFHYGKHNVFFNVYFDDKRNLVLAPKLSSKLKEIKYFSEECAITNVLDDFNKELDRLKKVLKDIKLGEVRLYDPIRDKYSDAYFL